MTRLPFLILLLSLLSGCASPAPPVTPTPRATFTPDPTLPPCTVSEQRYRDEQFARIWWRADSQAIFFQDQSGGTGFYDLAARDLQRDPAIDPPSSALLAWITNNTPSTIPPDDIYASPSGSNVIYTQPARLPTATPYRYSNPAGRPGYFTDLFAIRESDPRPVYLGQMEGSIGTLIWSQDEARAVIGSLYQADVQISLWLADLSENRLAPLPIRQDPQNERHPYPLDFTQDGARLMYTINDEVWLKDLSSGEETRLSTPGFFYHWWLWDDRFLVLLYDEAPYPDQWSLYAYDLSLDRLTRMSDIPLPSLGPVPERVILSPDRTKLAAVDDRFGLRVMVLCPEQLFTQ